MGKNRARVGKSLVVRTRNQAIMSTVRSVWSVNAQIWLGKYRSGMVNSYTTLRMSRNDSNWMIDRVNHETGMKKRNYNEVKRGETHLMERYIELAKPVKKKHGGQKIFVI